MAEETPQKICFVICPIGSDGSATRDRSDKVFNHIIKPVVESLGYEAMRSDHDSRPGKIGNQIIRHLVDDPLVVADLTDENPNVFYELAIRHMVEKPFIHIMQKGQKPPFDVGDNRTIFVDHTDLDSVAACMKQLKQQIREVENDPSLVENPISVAIERRALEKSDDPTDRGFAEILTRLDQLTARVNSIAPNPQTRPSSLDSLVAAVSFPTLLPDVDSHGTIFQSVLTKLVRDYLGEGETLDIDEFIGAQDAFDKQQIDGLVNYLSALSRARKKRRERSDSSDGTDHA